MVVILDKVVEVLELLLVELLELLLVDVLEPFVHVEVVAGPVGVSPLLTQPSRLHCQCRF